MTRSNARFLGATLATVALIAVSTAQTPQPAGGGLQPQGIRVAIPDAPECAIYVTAWENGSWFAPGPNPDQRTLQTGTTVDSSDARRDVADITRWLVQLMEQSPDMAAKTKAACQATGTNFIQIAIVRDDPEAGPGAWLGGTPLILIDTGDIEKLGKNTESPGTGNPSLEQRARLQVGALLPVSLIAHELDHAKRAKERSEFYTALSVVRRLPNLAPDEIEEQNKNEKKFHDQFEQFAVDDENTVIRELDDFKRSGYGRTAYTDGKGGIPFVIDGIPVRVNAANALGRVEHVGDEHRYGDLSTGDATILEKTSKVIDRALDKSSVFNEIGDPERSGDVFVFRRTRPSDAFHGPPFRAASMYSSNIWRARLDRLSTATSPSDAADANVSKVNSASGTDKNQEAGGTVATFFDNA